MNRISRRFKRNIVESRFTPIVFALIAIAMRLVMFLSVDLQQQEYPTSFVWKVISPLFANNWVSLAGSTFSIFAIAYTISQLNLRFTLIRFRTAFPFSLMVVFLSIHPFFLQMSPSYVSTFFILLALFPLLHSYQHHSPNILAFKSGVLLAIAGTFQVYALVFILLWWYGKTSMHSFRIKSFIALTLGAFLVFWNVAGFYFIFDDLQSFLIPFTYFAKIELALPIFSLPQWIGIGIMVLLSVIFLTLDLSVYIRERVLTQKTLSFITTIIIFSFLLHFIYFRQTLLFVYLIAILVSFVIAHYYSHTKTKWQVYSFILLLAGLFIVYVNYLIQY